MRRLPLILLATACLPTPSWAQQPAGAPAALMAWPAPTATQRPWTRWWWLGSAVDQPNLNRLLTAFRDAGLGGVEICPIYGAKGYESRFITYLSPQWMGMYAYTVQDAAKLGLGVDLTTGTGWPMGGPWIDAEHASSEVEVRRFDVAGGVPLAERLPAARLQCLRAIGPDGSQLDLTSQVKDGRLAWTPPPGAWRLYGVFRRVAVQQVKRSAPGGEGNVLDPLSPAAMDAFLARFEEAFTSSGAPPPRAEFHDSYEYYSATWTPDFFAEFARRRGYDLRDQLPAFFGEGDPDIAARVKYDYRLTVSDLHQAYIARWTAWSHAHGSVTREQAHGAPANIEDVYATADIPETEGSFGGIVGGADQQPMMKFASSAAHVTGRTLASSETFTWLGEHFQVPLAALKPTVDFFFLAGINHIFFHGIPYSPADAPWPGWLFYASVNLGPEGGLWHDLPAFNAYATRCMTLLQGGKPDNDLLLYFPVADFWEKDGGLPPQAREGDGKGARPNAAVDRRRLPRDDGIVIQFSTPGKWLSGTPFHDAAMAMMGKGYSYDEVTDQILTQATAAQGCVMLGGNSYRAVVVPPTRYMPLGTLRGLLALANGGATILVQGDLAVDVPGLDKLAERRATARGLLAGVAFGPASPDGVRRATVGKGFLLTGPDLGSLLAAASLPREEMVDAGLSCVRRLRPDGVDYFVVNTGTHAVDGWVALSTPAAGAVILDPLSADRAGLAAVRQSPTGRAEIYLQLSAGESRVVRTFSGRAPEVPAWPYAEPAGAGVPIAGHWSVHFTQGGPVLPRDFDAPSLGSWTLSADPEAKRFAGTAVYRTTFNVAPGAAAGQALDLGRVGDSARVRINGQDAGTAWCAPFVLPVGKYLHPGHNLLEVEVTNVAANRIADLDRRHVSWKSFYEINFVNFQYKPFDASAWPVRDSGLLGPVTLVPQAPLQAGK